MIILLIAFCVIIHTLVYTHKVRQLDAYQMHTLISAGLLGILIASIGTSQSGFMINHKKEMFIGVLVLSLILGLYSRRRMPY